MKKLLIYLLLLVSAFAYVPSPALAYAPNTQQCDTIIEIIQLEVYIDSMYVAEVRYVSGSDTSTCKIYFEKSELQNEITVVNSMILEHYGLDSNSEIFRTNFQNVERSLNCEKRIELNTNIGGVKNKHFDNTTQSCGTIPNIKQYGGIWEAEELLTIDALGIKIMIMGKQKLNL